MGRLLDILQKIPEARGLEKQYYIQKAREQLRYGNVQENIKDIKRITNPDLIRWLFAIGLKQPYYTIALERLKELMG